MERLQKILSKAGIASRRASEKLIEEGRVTVNGTVITQAGTQADAESDIIEVDGVRISAPEKHVYFLLNKPKGFISTAKDERGRRTVLTLLADIKERVYPIGRLDNNTEGLLLITNDGELMNGLLHPKFQVEKTYIARLSSIPTESDLEKLRKGIVLDDGPTSPAKVVLIDRNPVQGGARVEITIHEGRNRQVRRMFAAIGFDVVALKRIEFAGLNLSGVRRGQYRPLTDLEIAHLRELAGQKEPQK